jgi:hypothetical protein
MTAKSRSEVTPQVIPGARPGEAQAAPVTPIPLLTPVPISPPFAALELASGPSGSVCGEGGARQDAAAAPPSPAPEPTRPSREARPACPIPRPCCDALPSEETHYTGEALRRAREARGVTIAQLCERTKILRSHMENVEADRYEKLPAPVYLRGILMALAKELRLDGQRVARSYLEAAGAAARGRGD